MSALVYVAWLPQRVVLAATLAFRGGGGLGGILLVVALCNVWFLYFPHTLPRTFIEGVGLTQLKLGTEYCLIIGYAVAAWGFGQKTTAKNVV